MAGWRLVSDGRAVLEAGASFFARLTPADLSARRLPGTTTTLTTFTNAHEYAAFYLSTLSATLAPEDAGRLAQAVGAADGHLSQFTRISELPWNIAVPREDVEGGLPHTLGSVIVMPLRYVRRGPFRDLVKTLIHEKVHVYQRVYPRETHALLLDQWRLTVVGFQERDPLARSNPDINELAYAGPSGAVCRQVYTSSAPQSLFDSRVICVPTSLPHGRAGDTEVDREGYAGYEHPYEAMAYILADLAVSPRADVAAGPWRALAREWMVEYL